MDYTETLDFLYSSLPMYQRIGKAAYKSDLNTTIRLDNHMGNPHRSFKSIHIAGTNGKGSVSHMLAAILQSSGYNTGLYTSPHLVDFRERIRINGKMIEKEYVVEFVKKYQDIIRELKPSFFEITAAMSFEYFKEMGVDYAVIETGMGGRLDSTNIVFPELSVITNIGYDHTQYLGDTLRKIAIEKAGIIKRGVPVVIGESNPETDEVFRLKAEELGSDISSADQNFITELVEKSYNPFRNYYRILKEGNEIFNRLETDLTGYYQRMNIKTVFQVIDILRKHIPVDDRDISFGLANATELTGMMGRWQILDSNPLIICDSAHNPEGIKEVIKQISDIKAGRKQIVFGMVNDKEPGKILKYLPMDATYYFTRADIPRSMDPYVLKKKAQEFSLKGDVYSSVKEAIKEAKKKANYNDLIFVGGSTFIVADLLKVYFIN